MEVWALEGFGVAHILQEILTYKSDHLIARQEILNATIWGKECLITRIRQNFFEWVSGLAYMFICPDASTVVFLLSSKQILVEILYSGTRPSQLELESRERGWIQDDNG
jgi:hypothetical protein